jgi:hypothetical protein
MGFGLTDIARIGVFSALAFGVNAPFLAIPNIELFSLSLFLSGVFLGLSRGLAVALIAGLLFVFFNPNGPQTILMVGAAQLLGFILFGMAGGIFRTSILRKQGGRKTIFLLLIIGGFLTLWYDFSTNITFALVFGPFWQILIAGLSFSVIHIVSNTIIFGLSSQIIHRIWKRVEYIMPPLASRY